MHPYIYSFIHAFTLKAAAANKKIWLKTQNASRVQWSITGTILSCKWGGSAAQTNVSIMYREWFVSGLSGKSDVSISSADYDGMTYPRRWRRKNISIERWRRGERWHLLDNISDRLDQRRVARNVRFACTLIAFDDDRHRCVMRVGEVDFDNH